MANKSLFHSSNLWDLVTAMAGSRPNPPPGMISGTSSNEADKVFVVLPREYEDGIQILYWALDHFRKEKTKIIITHIAFLPLRSDEMDHMAQTLNNYLSLCAAMEFGAEKLVDLTPWFLGASINSRLQCLIDEHGIKDLIMGATPNREKTGLMPKTAAEQMTKANRSCRLWFIHDGKLIFTREPQSNMLKSAPLEKNETDLLKQEIEQLKQKNSLLDKENEQLKIEIQSLKIQRDENLNQLKKTNEEKQDLQVSSTIAKEHLTKLQALYNQLQQKLDNAVKEAEELRNQKEHSFSRFYVAFNSEYSLQELQQATQNFSDSLKLGEGGFGCVYKGSLRKTTVAIKKLHPQSLQGQSEFKREIAILTRVRHPNLVTLIGACSEAFALVYEFLPNGSLEDRIVRANNTPPLTWQVRTRIIGEICLALIFLHSHKPNIVVHGDLKPDNILLDANLISKLSDFGISRLLNQPDTNTTAFYQTSHPIGTFAYIDPEFLLTGKLTPQSDVYSFGIIILRLITGKPPLNIARIVEEGMKNGNFQSLIDESAGRWPCEEAKKLAEIGLRCADMYRSRRPKLVSEVWTVVEPLMKAASSAPGSSIDESRIPSQFICPIFQDIMKDPYIAADGFTYEAEAIKCWFNSGHNTSPMTNLPLSRHDLIPNIVLRSAIQEWIEQHPQMDLS